MNILKYGDYITEKMAYSMILESKVVLSQKFINLLTRMKSNNKIAASILSFQSKDVDGIAQNYIDSTDSKEELSFTPDRRVQQMIEGKPEYYKVTNSGRYLTHSDRNNKIFERLGYDKEGRSNWAPDMGTIVEILSETQSNASNNTYCMVKEINHTGTEPRIGVINKVAMQIDSDEFLEIWKTARNPVKVGRFARAFLTKAKVTFTDQDIEEFVNQYKATYDFAADILKQFDIVQGSKITHWYWHENYQNGGGTLNNSCMSEVDEEWLDIYSQNNNVSLVILYNDNGEVKDGKYVSNLIKGRAILWDCKIDGQSAQFMDRIYTTQDSDVVLFKQFAEKNGWWYKTDQSMSPEEDITNGSSVKSAKIVSELGNSDLPYLPYMDTMCFINTSNGIVGNSLKVVDPDREFVDDYEDYDGAIRVARSTDGEWYTADNY